MHLKIRSSAAQPKRIQAVNQHPFHPVATVALALALSACSHTPQPSASEPPDLTLQPWKAVLVSGEETGDNPPTLKFDKEGHSSGFAGCNRFVGQYTFSADQQLLFGKLASTRMACVPPRDQLEDRFLRGLETVRRVEAFDQGIRLLDGQGLPVMVLEPTS